MGKRFDYEFVVIGGGVAGINAAKQLTEAGRKVAIIEQDKLGGSDLSSTDLVHKSLFSFSHLYAHALGAGRFGLSSKSLRYNYPTLVNWREKIAAKAAVSKKSLEDLGIAVIKGRAHFITSYDVAVDGKGQISANKFLIATGSTLSENGIAGLETVPHLDTSNALRISKVPKAAIIVGGGASGCELAQYYAELGAKVVIVEKQSRLLPTEDIETSGVIEQYFIKKLGIKVFTDTNVVALEKDKVSSRVVFTRGGQEKTVRVETIVLATGSEPCTDLGLGNAGVKFNKNGISVDRTLQTSARNIWAAGDVIGGYSSREKSLYSSEVAVINMIGKNRTFVNYDGFMRMVDTDPQVAAVGYTEEELKKRGRRYKKAIVPLGSVNASITNDFKIGFLKVMSDVQGKVLGATMVGPNAADVMQEVALAVRHGLPVVQIASTPHVAGEWGALVKEAARKLLIEGK